MYYVILVLIALTAISVEIWRLRGVIKSLRESVRVECNIGDRVLNDSRKQSIQTRILAKERDELATKLQTIMDAMRYWKLQLFEAGEAILFTEKGMRKWTDDQPGERDWLQEDEREPTVKDVYAWVCSTCPEPCRLSLRMDRPPNNFPSVCPFNSVKVDVGFKLAGPPVKKDV